MPSSIFPIFSNNISIITFSTSSSSLFYFNNVLGPSLTLVNNLAPIVLELALKKVGKELGWEGRGRTAGAVVRPGVEGGPPGRWSDR